ncbi:stalk domain-containing protein [Paenibacillus silviterrae]|uniref:stalk domain-containing protein n=1 Tax=Paenibacillus silviterrae TaxID=3242194 RepID=UPI0025437C8F|nr:stalk domain-containing protein [Paenibacillus chinjuensis]
MKKKLGVLIIALCLLGSHAVYSAGAEPAPTEQNQPSPEAIALLKQLGASDEQISTLGTKVNATAYAAKTRKLEGEALQQFIQTYLSLFPPIQGAQSGMLIGGYVEYQNGVLASVTPPHGPYDHKPHTAVVNGVNLFPEQAELPLGLLPAREVLESMGFTVTEHGQGEELEAVYGSRTLLLKAGSSTIEWEGQSYAIDEPVQRTGTGWVAPEQLLTDVLGVRVERNTYNKTTYVNSEPLFFRTPHTGNGSNGYTVSEVIGWTNPALTIQWNGVTQPLASIPLNVGGINYLPAEEAGALVDHLSEWYGGIHFTRSSLLKGSSEHKPAQNAKQQQISAYTGVLSVYVNGVKQEPLHPPVFYINRWFLSVEDMARFTGFEVAYDHETRTTSLLKPTSQWMIEKLVPGVSRNGIRSRFGNPSATVINGAKGNNVWRYDGKTDPDYQPALEEHDGVRFDGVDLAGLVSGKLSYQAFIECHPKELSMSGMTVYYTKEGKLFRFTLREDGSRQVELVS